MDRIVNDTKEIRGITGELKAEDPMRWVGEMNNIFSLAEEIVMEEVIYSRVWEIIFDLEKAMGRYRCESIGVFFESEQQFL